MMIAANKLVKHFFPANQLLVASVTFFLAVLLASTGSLAQNKKIKRAKDKMSLPSKSIVRKATKDFKACRSEIMKDLKAGKFPRKELKEKMATCRNTYAGGKLYLECKKDALRGSAKKGARTSKKKLKECRSLLGQASYSPKKPLPFLVHKGKAYFAGLSLNGEVEPFAERPNFSCSPLERSFKEIEPAKHLFFGNQPDLFDDYDPEIFTAWEQNADDSSAYFLGLSGKVYKEEDESLLYFPSGECFLEDSSGSIFKSLSIYYLLSPELEKTYPYVGVGFYEEAYKSTTIKDIVSKFNKQFGKKLAVTKNGLKTFLSARKIKNFDSEGDPKNVCKGKGIGRYLVVIKARENSKRFPDYVLMANIEQLCEFGEDAVSRLKSPN